MQHIVVVDTTGSGKSTYALHSHKRKQDEFTRDLARPDYAHLQLFRFSAPGDTAAWLAGIGPSP